MTRIWGLLLSAAIATVAPLMAVAVPVTLDGSGVWTEVEPEGTANLAGLGTDAITWGTPLDNSPSGYSFAGNSTMVDEIDGTIFTVGTFTHDNFRLAVSPEPPSITGATLEVAFDISNGTSVNRSFTFMFVHNETPNGANPCPDPFVHPNPGGGGCEDVVSLQTVFSQEVLDFDGLELKLEIVGFLAGGMLVDQFLTAENASNSASIQARFTSEFPVPLPEPGSWILLLTGLAWIGLGRKSKER